jgi:hypothetical protein
VADPDQGRGGQGHGESRRQHPHAASRRARPDHCPQAKRHPTIFDTWEPGLEELDVGPAAEAMARLQHELSVLSHCTEVEGIVVGEQDDRISSGQLLGRALGASHSLGAIFLNGTANARRFSSLTANDATAEGPFGPRSEALEVK